MSLASRLSDLVTISPPIQLSENVPPFWIKQEGQRRVALFESLEAFEEFCKWHAVFTHSFEYLEIDDSGILRVHMGYVQ